MTLRTVATLTLFCLAAGSWLGAPPAQAEITGWTNWRGPAQNGTSPQKLQVTVGPDADANATWTFKLPGRGTPAIGNYPDGRRLFALGYEGQGPELLETLVCLNPDTGEEYWRRGYADFISDVIYNRYSIGGPTIDPETGNVYIHTSPGLVIALDYRTGRELWQVSLMESYGRLTFPNGRTGVVTIDGPRAIVNIISSNWGGDGPARNRFYAFNKHNGELLWASTPGIGPPFLKDSSFSTPFIENRYGRRVFYAGTGCGNIAAIDMHTGRPLWRYQMSLGGVNASPVVHPGPDGNLGNEDDLLIVPHGRENVGDTGRGYIAAFHLKPEFFKGDEYLQLDDTARAWRNDEVSMFTSSPTLVGDTVYQCTIDGHFVAVEALTGKTLWKKKLVGSQLHASPVYADGKLYIPKWSDGVFIVTPGTPEPKIEHITDIDGEGIGSPAVIDGQLFIHTTEKLYCFGTYRPDGKQLVRTVQPLAAGAPAGLKVVPAEFALRPGAAKDFTAYMVDGNDVLLDVETPIRSSEKWIPPTARVRAELDGFPDAKRFTASSPNAPSAGALKFTNYDGSLTGTVRGRVVPEPPFSEDFEEFSFGPTDPRDNVSFAHPPLAWIGARLKWQVRPAPDDPTNKVLAKTLDRVLFQRSMVFMGHPDDTGYTIQADVMSDGNRRGMSVVGVICQRYIIALDGNKQEIEVSSNHERVKQSVRYTWQPKQWYTIKARVDANPDGSGVVRGKVWPRGTAEPADWNIEAQVPNVHKQGAPALYGFSPQIRHRVYIDNVVVTPNS